MTTLPIDQMVKDADELVDECSGYALRSMAGDVACHVKALACEVERLERDRKTAIEAASGGVGWWSWQGDDEDHLESLTCPILISADQMRELHIYKQAMESMAAQFICPKMTALDLARQQLGE